MLCALIYRTDHVFLGPFCRLAESHRLQLATRGHRPRQARDSAEMSVSPFGRKFLPLPEKLPAR